jgi:hypothetical protein
LLGTIIQYLFCVVLGSTPNEKKRERKIKKKLRKAKELEEEGPDNKKKKFISKANPNLKNQQKGGQLQSGVNVKEETNGMDVTPAVEKTPLRKKPVVKSNGEVVYSKFDFISGDKRQLNGGGVEQVIKPKPEELLKKVQKAESTIAKLATEGRANDAELLVQSQKWESALKRAQGEKIRDDPTLLKKTIKKMDKRKQVRHTWWIKLELEFGILLTFPGRNVDLLYLVRYIIVI